jgi:hypothetical protein
MPRKTTPKAKIKKPREKWEKPLIRRPEKAHVSWIIESNRVTAEAIFSSLQKGVCTICSQVLTPKLEFDHWPLSVAVLRDLVINNIIVTVVGRTSFFNRLDNYELMLDVCINTPFFVTILNATLNEHAFVRLLHRSLI